MKKIFTKFIAILSIIVICFSITGCSLFADDDTGNIKDIPNSTTVSKNINFTTQDPATREELSYIDAAALVKRAVVAIQVTNSSGSGYGSGVIVDSDFNGLGENEHYIITCHHVISSGGEITVYVPDANSLNTGDDGYDSDNYVFTGVIDNSKNSGAVELVGGDKDGDIAVLRIDTTGRNTNIQAAKVPVNTYKTQYGEQIFAIGNPSGSAPMTFMAGNISYLNRKVTISSVGIMNLIQHDSMINHGSSGGGLFNMYGELIGITNGGSDTYRGLNYAIPFDGDTGYINIAKQLIATETNNNFGYVTGRWILGITVQEGTNAHNGETYLKINSIEPNSIASKCNLQVGDIIRGVKYNNGAKEVTEEVATQSGFAAIMNEIKYRYRTGQSFTLVVYRNFNDVQVTINLDKQFIFCDTGVYN